MDGQERIVFAIVNRETGVTGYTWMIESHRTSFYIKPTFKALQLAKASIHGPDPDHPGKEHFRFDFTDPKVSKKAVNAGGGWHTFGTGLPLYFTGRPVNKRTVHLARFSAEANMFRRGMQRAPNPVPLEKATLNAILKAPKVGDVIHVDLYLSRVRPFWQNREAKLRQLDAGIGPLLNGAGQYLTAVVAHRCAGREPDPIGDPSAGVPEKDCTRGMAVRADTTGLLWICEKMIPNSGMRQVQPPQRADR
ncbi:hypothetical protein A5719_03365 [Mycolicibacterium peregrinum]|nr:hypothetical protein A5719_03365 [Mycolicibacterium peregrinum]